MDADYPHKGVLIPRRFTPESGVSAFEKVIAPLPIETNGEAVAWFSKFFGHRRTVAINLSDDAFTSNLILRLLRLAYTHVRVVDDIQHEGVYTPTTRDDAMHARNNILNALLGLKGEQGWAAKVEIANDPLVVHIRDRLMALAIESAAQEVDGVAFTYQQLAGLDRFGEAAPATRDAMFELLCDRLDDLDDLLLQDISPREGWAEMQGERLLRRGIAHELDQMANHCYTVVQESVTADEKETDIRMRSTFSDQQATIELKVGESWSGAELCNTLREQLVERYMAADACRAGCLLITAASEKLWKYPDTPVLMDFDQLIDFLNLEAAKLMVEYGGAIRLLVKGLDLRPRIK